jgi:hypothetical protein
VIDFDSIVLGPCLDAFARPVIVIPRKSQPGHPEYAARGIWDRRPSDVDLLDGGVLGSDTITLGVRLSEFPVPPVKGDRVYIPASGPLEHVGTCEIDDDGKDPNGGYEWVLKIIDESVRL